MTFYFVDKNCRVFSSEYTSVSDTHSFLACERPFENRKLAEEFAKMYFPYRGYRESYDNKIINEKTINVDKNNIRININDYKTGEHI